MPGARFDEKSHLPMSIYKGEWKECEYTYIIAATEFNHTNFSTAYDPRHNG